MPNTPHLALSPSTLKQSIDNVNLSTSLNEEESAKQIIIASPIPK